MAADSEHSPDQPAQDQVPDWEMADLPVPGEPDGYPDPVPGQPDRYPDLVPGQPDKYPDLVPGEPDLYPDLVPGQADRYPDDAYDDGSAQRAAFADGGWADALAPDPVLATLVDLVQRDDLGKLDDDQLTGVLQAANRLAAWSASGAVSYGNR